ncbi:hypothetical protein HRbin22_01376 [Candidatus Thermoflexus japonica]|uniref:Uncharacterized protein n=1 Tax=Candidatus Thermoflexus japonica TaxID=2035417 RepID=A0A2H5Y6Q9_9CHLR|nr:hypothetical protein HRbin22_01376 [Candidatus Thermoflexus japonica]
MSIWKEIYEYLTYDYYGKRRWRPAAYGLLLTLAVAAGMLLAGGIFALQAPRGARPAPTLPPPTATAVFATVTAAAVRPTATPAPQCPEDPILWKLVEVRPFLDPKTGKSVQLPKPPQRIDPPCVYEALARDFAHTLVPNPDIPAPSAEKTLSVPWFWAPGTEIPQIQLKSGQVREFSAPYDARGRRIDRLFLSYTAVATGDPDFPVLVYIYEDAPQAAWLIGRQAGEEDQWYRLELQGGEVYRFIAPMAYDGKGRRWVRMLYRSPLPPRWSHAVPAGSVESLAQLLGFPLWRRSELLSRFGLNEVFPDTVNPSSLKPELTVILGPNGVERR